MSFSPAFRGVCWSLGPRDFIKGLLTPAVAVSAHRGMLCLWQGVSLLRLPKLSTFAGHLVLPSRCLVSWLLGGIREEGFSPYVPFFISGLIFSSRLSCKESKCWTGSALTPPQGQCQHTGDRPCDVFKFVREPWGEPCDCRGKMG